MCSMPELGAVDPATPIAIPLRVRIRASSARLAGLSRSPVASSSSRSPYRRFSPATAGL
jgi:hypothetical protein